MNPATTTEATAALETAARAVRYGRWRASWGEAPITSGMALYSRLAYAYWVIAFMSGGLLVGTSRRTAQAAALLGPSVLG